jgi:hypothetical protein
MRNRGETDHIVGQIQSTVVALPVWEAQSLRSMLRSQPFSAIDVCSLVDRRQDHRMVFSLSVDGVGHDLAPIVDAIGLNDRPALGGWA